jgi:hypothetical protein
MTMKLILALTLTLGCTLASAQTKPTILVQNTNAAACAWIETTFHTPICTQGIHAILYPLPPDTDTVKFTMNYLDENGKAHEDIQRVGPDGAPGNVIANYVLYGNNLTIISITAVTEAPGESIEYIP